MFLSLDTLTPIVWAGLAILVELIELVNSSTALLDFFLSSDTSICLQWLSGDVYRVKVVTYLQT